jgi:Tfp pilus assembly protein PilO
VELTGTYNNLRSFIHAIESAPQFVVIENISLAEGTNENSLRLGMDLSTYYRSGSR